MSAGSAADSSELAPAVAEPAHAAAIVAVVQEILETEGYDAVQLRDVARRGRVSLSTITHIVPPVPKSGPFVQVHPSGNSRTAFGPLPVYSPMIGTR